MITARSLLVHALLCALACTDRQSDGADTGGSSTGGPTMITTPVTSTPPDGSSSGVAEATAVDPSSVDSTDGDADSTSTTGNMSPTDPGCPECIVLVTGLGGGRGLAIDVDYVYFTDQQAGTIARIRKGGGDGGVLVDGQSSPYHVAVDDTHVYWTNFTEVGAVMRVPKAGGAAETVANETRPRGIAIDATHVYWSTFDLEGDLWRRDLALADPPEALASLLGGIPSIAIAQGRVFMTAHTTSPGGGAFIEPPPEDPPVGSIFVYDPNGPQDPFENPSQLVSGQAQPWGIAIQGTRPFWANGDGVAANQPKSVVTTTLTGDATIALSSNNGGPWGVAVDADTVFFTDFDRVRSVAIEGGAPIELAELQDNARSIAVDDAFVFWITRERVLQRPKP